MRSDRLKGNLDLLLLSVLAAGPMHGYAAVQGLRDRSGGAFDLPEGTVYPALHALESAGLVEAEWTTASGRRRKVYRLTDRGAARLQQERDEWTAFTQAVAKVAGGAAWQT